MKAVFFTLGCKVNQYETEVIRNLLDKKNIFLLCGKIVYALNCAECEFFR